VVTAFPGSSVATSAVLQSDGRFVVAGTCKSATHEFCLARYNADGSLDSTFSSFGEVMTKLGTGDVFSFDSVLEADGKIVLSGYFSTTQDHDFTLVRYTSTGTLDATFCNGGFVATDFSGGTDDIAYALAAQRDGKLVAVGFTGAYPALISELLGIAVLGSSIKASAQEARSSPISEILTTAMPSSFNQMAESSSPARPLERLARLTLPLHVISIVRHSQLAPNGET
jgi:uncharacterized delta-60 repeat protein